MSAPKTTKAWRISSFKEGFNGLKYDTDREIPALGNRDVLVKIQGASINFRDLIIPKGKYPFPAKDNVVPGSDGAGEVVAVGKDVQRFKPGDKVVTLFNQKHLGGPLDPVSLASGLGGAVDGTFREYGAFEEDGLVRAPSNLSPVEASTLCCAGLTAWNALFGIGDKKLKPGDWVLTEGTGGVSIFGVQFAKATGASVVATTGSEEKAALLKKLGADHIINYKQTPQWGEEAKKLTGGKGFAHIIEVAGPRSMQQSLNSVAIGGVISMIGFVGGGPQEKEPSFMECLSHMCMVRGILVGDRVQLEELVRAVEANENLRPVVDKQVFSLDKLVDAYEYQWSQKHIGNVCLKVQD